MVGVLQIEIGYAWSWILCSFESEFAQQKTSFHYIDSIGIILEGEVEPAQLC